MARETLDNKIRFILDQILILDSMVEDAIINSVDALKRRDMDMSKRVYAGDNDINRKRFELENEIIITIATTQPVMATDLRLLASCMDVVGELERIGDYAKGIANIGIKTSNQPHVKPLIDIPRMAEIAVDMLHRAIGAFVAKDLDTAREIPSEDDKVDALYNQVYRELVTLMIQKPEIIDRANYLMWAAHNLERMADRVTNICERTAYIVTGQLLEYSSSDDEMIAPE
jgi:phosphate transport system protein